MLCVAFIVQVSLSFMIKFVCFVARCCNILEDFIANTVNSDQTAPHGAVLTWPIHIKFNKARNLQHMKLAYSCVSAGT